MDGPAGTPLRVSFVGPQQDHLAGRGVGKNVVVLGGQRFESRDVLQYGLVRAHGEPASGDEMHIGAFRCRPSCDSERGA